MGKKLSQMTTAEFKAEMSIAGNPEKIMAIWGKMLGAAHEVDANNAAELINLEFAVKRLHAEVKWLMRRYEKRTGQKIM